MRKQFKLYCSNKNIDKIPAKKCEKFVLCTGKKSVNFRKNLKNIDMKSMILDKIYFIIYIILFVGIIAAIMIFDK